MPAPKVRTDHEALTRLASQFSQSADKTRQMTQNVKNKMNVLQGGDWVGKGAKEFYSEMSSAVLPAFGRLSKALDSASRTTKRISQIMQTAEDDAARLFKGDGASGSGQAGGAGNREEEEGSFPLLGGLISSLTNDFQSGLEAIKRAMGSDPDVLKHLRETMPTDDYLALLPLLPVFETGSKPHTHPTLADQYIQDALAEYVIDAVGAGRKITGQVSVVGDEDWDIAGRRQYGEDVWNSGKRNRVGGFVDDEDRVWIHKDKGNAGTMIHEGLHKYASDEMNIASHDLSEGVTEYFTRKTIEDVELTIPRVNYQDNYEFASILVDRMGEATVAAAYFDGDMEGLKTSFMNLGSGKSEEDWTTFLGHTKDERWAEAEMMLVD